MYRLVILFCVFTYSMISCGREGLFETETENIPVEPVLLKDLAIVGFVKDVSGIPIADAEIRIGQITVKSDLQGLYQIEKISISSSGSLIVASKQDFESEIIKVEPGNQSIVQIDFNLKKSNSIITENISPGNSKISGLNFTLDVNQSALYDLYKQNEYIAQLETRSSTNASLPVLFPVSLKPGLNQDVEITEQFELRIQTANNRMPLNRDATDHHLQIMSKDKNLYKLDLLRGIWIVEKPVSGNLGYKISHKEIYGIGNQSTRIPVKIQVMTSQKLPLTNNLYQIKKPNGQILALGITNEVGVIQARLPNNQEFFIEVSGGCGNTQQKIASGKTSGDFMDLGTVELANVTGLQISFKDCSGNPVINTSPITIEIKQGQAVNKLVSVVPSLKGIVSLCPGNGLIEITVKNREKLEGSFQFSDQQIVEGKLILHELHLCRKEDLFGSLEIDNRKLSYKGDDFKILRQDGVDIGVTDFGDLTFIVSKVSDKGIFSVSQFVYLKQPRTECKNNCTLLKCEVIKFGAPGQVVELKISGNIDGKNIIGHFKNIRFS